MKALMEARRKHRENLPIAAVKERLVEVIKFHDVVILVGETGSGKSTQLPQFLYGAGFARNGKVIGITQPRRVAAVTVAKRVSEEAGVDLGTLVGYSIRFDDKTSPSTCIKYLTDGLLLREALLDPYLTRYSVIIVDEAHERTVHTDVLLGLLKNIIKVRQNQPQKPPTSEVKLSGNTKLIPLKLIIMSASLDAKVFSDYFNNAKALHIEGRQHPVDTLYTVHPQTDYVEAAFVTLLQIHIEEPPGDILVFLTGQEEIESVENLVRLRLPQLPEKNRKVSVVPIFSSLPPEQQMRVFSPTPEGYRKVILATNIAETSVTIPNVKYVVDPGFVKARNYDPTKGIESLVVIPTSKAQALQRTGRAGRDGPGKCFRLYPESEFAKLDDSTVPEIKRCNLSNVILQLKALGVDDIMGFDFLQKPPRASIMKSLEQLFLLGGLTEECKLSDPLGHQMSRLPLDPVYSKALILGSQSGCLEEMLITVAMLSVESIFYQPREKSNEVKAAVRSFWSEDGDHLTLVNVFRGGEKARNEKMRRKWCKENFVNYRSLKHARDVYGQICGHLGQLNMKVVSCEGDHLRFRKCLAASFFQNAALKQSDGSYRALGSGQNVYIHPSSVLFQSKVDCVVFNELLETNRKYIRTVSRIDHLWLAEVAPIMYAINA